MIRRRPNSGTALALVALVIALGGSAFAAAEVVLPPNSVGALQLKTSAVTNPKIAANAVTGAKVRNGSLTRGDFASGQIPAQPGGRIWASGFVRQDGVLEPGSHNTALVDKRDVGSYHLEFGEPGGRCVDIVQVFSYLIVATGEQVPGYARSGMDVAGSYLDVSTVGPDFLPADRGFDYVVIC
jgi:hypothetical protein